MWLLLLLLVVVYCTSTSYRPTCINMLCCCFLIYIFFFHNIQLFSHSATRVFKKFCVLIPPKRIKSLRKWKVRYVANKSVRYLKFSHCLHDCPFDFRSANDVIVSQEMTGDSNESVFRPSLEPVHRTAGYQSRKLERSTPELLANLTRHTHTPQLIWFSLNKAASSLVSFTLSLPQQSLKYPKFYEIIHFFVMMCYALYKKTHIWLYV